MAERAGSQELDRTREHSSVRGLSNSGPGGSKGLGQDNGAVEGLSEVSGEVEGNMESVRVASGERDRDGERDREGDGDRGRDREKDRDGDRDGDGEDPSQDHTEDEDPGYTREHTVNGDLWYTREHTEDETEGRREVEGEGELSHYPANGINSTIGERSQEGASSSSSSSSTFDCKGERKMKPRDDTKRETSPGTHMALDVHSLKHSEIDRNQSGGVEVTSALDQSRVRHIARSRFWKMGRSKRERRVHSDEKGSKRGMPNSDTLMDDKDEKDKRGGAAPAAWWPLQASKASEDRWYTEGAPQRQGRTRSSVAMLLVVLLGCTGLGVDMELLSTISVGLSQLSTRVRKDVQLATKKEVPRMLRDNRGRLLRPLHEVTVTIFCAPLAYEGGRGERQRAALLSWLRHHPTPRVVLFGRHPSLHDVAKEFAPHVTVESAIDYNFRGIPLFNSIVARMQQQHSDTDVTLFVSAEAILMKNVFSSIVTVNNRHKDWVMLGMRWDATEFPFTFRQDPNIPFGYDPVIELAWTNGSYANDEDVIAYVAGHAMLHTNGEIEFWAWSHDEAAPLIQGPMPPLTHGVSGFDKWFTHELIQSGQRKVIDATHVATSIRLNLPKAQSVEKPRGNTSTSGNRKQTNTLAIDNGAAHETFLNAYLSQRHGSNFSSSSGTALDAPWKLASCISPRGAPEACLLPRVRPNSCPCEESAYALHDQHTPKLVLNGTKWSCGASISNTTSHNTAVYHNITSVPTEHSLPGLPHRLQDLLGQVVGSRSVPVVLTGITVSYLPLLNSFACQLLSLGVTTLIVAAYDEDAYFGAFQQGHAVYYEPSVWEPGSSGEPSHPRCTMEQPCVPSQLTRFKAAAINRIVTAGHSVLWSDVDVVWRTNVLPLVQILSKKTVALFLSSNEDISSRGTPDGLTTLHQSKDSFLRTISAISKAAKSLQAAVPKVLSMETSDKGSKAVPYTVFDQGFFYLPAGNRSENLTASLLRQAASMLGISEELLFMDVLCGTNLERYDPTVGECITQDGLRIVSVDSSLSIRAPLSEGGMRSNAEEAPSLVLHVNAVPTVDTKIALLKESGRWQYNETAMMCIHDWQTSNMHSLAKAS